MSLLDSRARETPEHEAYRFLEAGEGGGVAITWAPLAERARLLAAGMIREGLQNRPVIVAHPSGLEFITALFACWYAGAVAVPCYPPAGKRHRERLAAVLKDSGARHVLGDEAQDDAFARLGVSRFTGTAHPPDIFPAAAEGTCLLQYTSGSTASPKGVRISHANLLHQLDATRELFAPLELRSLLSWLPPYHDMGLVLKLLHALGSGIPLVFFQPEAFVQQPMRWLRAISRHRSEFSGAPNFAFELCLKAVKPEDLESLDLSCWKAAPCGAERIRPDTLARFHKTFAPCGLRPETILPGYGLAESTLTVTASRSGQPRRESRGLVSCGSPIQGMEVRIADPEHGENPENGASGEILVRGPSVTDGYWHRPHESAALLRPGGWLRTGDLGFMEGGELFVEARLKDLLIIDGTNHAPEDVEMAAASADPDLISALGAAFTTGTRGPERIVLAQEIPRLPPGRHAPLCAAIRHAVGESTGVALEQVLLVRSGTLPRTTSGKVRRAACRAAFLEDLLHVLHDDAGTPGESLDPDAREAWQAVSAAIVESTGRTAPLPDEDPAAFGLSSLDVTRLVALLRGHGGWEITIGEVFATRSFAALANLLSARAKHSPEETIPPAPAIPVPSHSQERMWFLHQLEPESAAYHVFGALDLDGPLDPAALDRAWRAILSRHEILRSRHGGHEGQPVITISDEPGEGIVHQPAGADLDAQLAAFARKPFDLAHDPPVRALHLRSGETSHVLALCAHHIVADGWSIRLLLGELTARYREEREAPQPLPAAVSPSYLDYAAWHRGRIESGHADKAIAWWRDRLAGHSGALSLPLDFARPARVSSEGGAIGLHLPHDLLEQVGTLATHHRTTPFCVFMAAFLITLRQHGGGDDLVLAVPVANRHHAASGPIIGTLVNTLPFRMELAPAESFAALLERVREDSFDMLEAQDAPFERIIEAVQPERALDRSPLAQVMFDHQEIPLATTWAGDLRCQPRLAHRGAAQFDLSVLLFAFSDHHEVHLEYRTDLFRRESMAALLDRYVHILTQAVSSPATMVGTFSALTPADHTRLDSTSSGPGRPEFIGRIPLHDIGRTIARLPHHAALICGDETITYSDLGDRIDRIAASLSARGIGPGQRVAVLLERDAWLPVVLLALWKLGAAYVPLDAANPPERLGWILEDQAPRAILASPSLADRLPAGSKPIAFLPAMADESHAAPAPVEIAAADPAYILYTSGSTGRPKGVVVSHGALGNFLLSMREQPGISEHDRVAALTTVSFDISALELYVPLIAGATIDLIPGPLARDGMALARHFENRPPSVLQATPATWRMLLDAGWKGAPDLKILCGGEALDLPLSRQLHLLGKEVWNLYGPTETTVWSTLWKVPPGADRILIGHPIANTDVHVLDSEGRPVPPGVTGELCIGGAGLANGYWNRPELTAGRFFSPPSTTNRQSSTLYRTGDLARRTHDGALECFGRSDGQVKVRGFRVELGEVETAMLSHPAVAEAVVVAEDGRLIGYYRSNSPSDAASLADHLAGRLPDYMVPAPLVAVEAMPLTASGKIDRRALSAIRPVIDDGKSAPHDPLEAEIAAAWQELLGCGPIGREDDFFALGGHSLLATRMTAELSRRLGFPVALDSLFQRSTVAGFSIRLRETSAVDLEAPRAILLHRGTSEAPPLFWIHTLIDGGMGLFPYRQAAAMVDQTSYGIAEGTTPFDCLGKMAARYVTVMRGIQPEGPYRIAGFCFGGNLAAEIAWQLVDAGESVESLMLLEATPAGAPPSALSLLKPAGWVHLAAQLRRHAPRIARFDALMMRRRFAMKGRTVADALHSLIRPRGIPDIHGVLDLSLLDETATARAIRHWEALHRHAPRLPAVSRLLIVRAGEDGWLPRPHDLGWKRHARSPLETAAVTGRHEEFLRGGSAKEVAAVISRHLRDSP